MSIGKRPTTQSDTTEDQSVVVDNVTVDTGVKEITNLVTEPKKLAVQDLALVPHNTIIRYVSGASLKVTYYRNIRALNTTTKIFDVNDVNPVQQFDVIEGLEIKVQGDINPAGTQQDDDKSFNITGSAIVYVGVKPNVNDVLTFDWGGGYLALFTVTNSVQATARKGSVYTIEMKMLAIVTEDIATRLEQCTVTRAVYVPERLDAGKTAVITEEDYARYRSVGELIEVVSRNYLYDFYDRDTKTLALETSMGKFADMLLVHFAKRMGIGTGAQPLEVYGLPPYRIREIPSMYESFYTQTANVRNIPMSMFHRMRFEGIRAAGSIGWTSILYTVLPTNSDHIANLAYNRWTGTTEPLKLLNGASEGPVVALEGFSTEKSTIAYAQVNDGAYVFSEAFYSGEYKSAIEFLLRQYLQRKHVPALAAMRVAEAVMHADPFTRYYLTPFTILLLRYSEL